MIEADFHREYQIDLMASLGGMSWRRFLVLLHGLSLDSRFVQSLVQENRQGRVITDPKQAERLLKRWHGA